MLLFSLSSATWADAESPSISVAEQREQLLAAERWDAVQVCFGCHIMTEELISQQPRRRQKKHRKAMLEQRSCLDCHTNDDVACCHFRMFPEIDRWE
tara:strand:+ start:383 stop:673 length:291 start_codon:yes stop_codon:yes gene_type:complete